MSDSVHYHFHFHYNNNEVYSNCYVNKLTSNTPQLTYTNDTYTKPSAKPQIAYKQSENPFADGYESPEDIFDDEYSRRNSSRNDKKECIIS